MILGISINCRIAAMKSGVLILSKKFNGLKVFLKECFKVILVVLKKCLGVCTFLMFKRVSRFL